MDLTLAETFLTVANAGSLVRAADRLHVTQAAVSARLQSLEGLVEKKLFVRNKAGARLTPAGRALLPYVTQLTEVWEEAKMKVKTQSDDDARLSIGGEVSLWNVFLLGWLVALRSSRPQATLRTQVDTVTRLLDQVQGGTLDLAIVYAPHKRPGVDTHLLLEEELVAVSTDPSRSHLDLEDYVLVDWGPDFMAQHEQAFPELRAARTTVALGPLGLRFVLEAGGTGYFRTRAVAPFLEKGALFLVPDVPKFSYSVHAAISKRASPETISWALTELRSVTQGPIDHWL